MKYEQTNRLLQVSIVGDDSLTDKFVVERLSGSEYLSRDFHFDVELFSDDPDVTLEEVQGKTMAVSLVRSDGSRRVFTGIVQHFAYVDGEMRDMYAYHARIVPWLSYAKLRRNCRLFLGQTRQQQLTTLLQAYQGVAQWEWKITGPAREFTMCAQFNETDHNYLSYRLETDGAVTRFEHTEQGHRWIVEGDTLNPAPIDGVSTEIAFHGQNGNSVEMNSIVRWARHREWGATSVALSSYDLRKPTPVHVDVPTTDTQDHIVRLQNHEFEGNYGFTDPGDGERLARQRMEEIEVRNRQYKAHSTNPYIGVLRWFELTGYTGSPGDASEFVISEIHHEAKNNYAQGDSARPEYKNWFLCHPKAITWRPTRGLNSVLDRVATVQTATVVGKGGTGATDVDEFGRVLLRFHWDRDGQSTCRARLLTPAGGGEHGFAGYPRVGSEVSVIFEMGNPDHPLVSGVVANGNRMPPWKLPEQSNLSGWRSRENTGGGGNSPGGRSNHVLFDDTPEQLQTQLKSDHQSSSLSLGFVTRVEDTSGRKDARGQGAELRTDGVLSNRAAKGLLVSTDARSNGQGHITDLSEPVQRLTDAQTLHRSLSEAAQAAQAHDANDQTPVVKELQQQAAQLKGTGGDPKRGAFPEFQEPHVLMTSAAGIEVAAAGTTHIASNAHTALTSGGHTSISSGKSLLASVKDGVRLFAQNLGMRLVAASGDIDLKALKDSINLLAKLNITQTADSITISAKTKLTVSGGGSGTTWDAGGIVSQTRSGWVVHAASFSMDGPSGVGQPSLPASSRLPLGQLDLLHRYVNESPERQPQGVRQGSFKVRDSANADHGGTLDGSGFNSVASVPMGMAEVDYEKDPRNPWDQGSYFGEAKWPQQQPAATSVNGSAANPAASAATLGAVSSLAKSAMGGGGASASGLMGAATGIVAAARPGLGAQLGQVQQVASTAMAVKQEGAKALLSPVTQKAQSLLGQGGMSLVAGHSAATNAAATTASPALAAAPPVSLLSKVV